MGGVGERERVTGGPTTDAPAAGDGSASGNGSASGDGSALGDGSAAHAHGSDFLQLDADAAPPGGKADWLVGQLRRAMADGRLTVGSRLPPTRVLAAELRVSRGVVAEAYRRLTEDGRVEGRRRGGTVVVAVSTASVPPSVPPAGAAPPGALFLGTPGADVFDALRAAPCRVDFTPGRPDLTAFPRSAWLRAERAVLGELSAEHLGYGDPRGAPELRRAVAGWLARGRGIRVEPDEVLVVAGTAQALTLLHPVLRADGIDAVAVEDPGSLGTRQHLEHGGLAAPPVPVDEDGVRVDALRATGARAVLLTPAHQFPTGVVTSGERRRELLRWAADGGLIIEDDYDAEHRYDRPPVPALRAFLDDRVCYLGSVSKLLAPALRIGWAVPPRRHREALVDAKRFTDLGNAVLPQLVLARLMESGGLERHLRLLRGRHRRRRDAMIHALTGRLPGAVVHGAAAGLHLTVTYAPDVPDTELAAAALARGVKVQPLSWHRQRPGRPGLVLGYAATPAGVIPDGVASIGEALRELS
ncbi:PLP-dependent aminotransferase family protein [Streptomyces sp. A012304]|uniref:MocR-like pyridoxine biosynthesis transcription factor PdxR n=1 Tax=Streptomyces sp. A012304 TaxID=375446 RepID=UPI0022301B43|nr:PLP-dependent aminotransferase family protein [Streptomyces sp. A012304]